MDLLYLDHTVPVAAVAAAAAAVEGFVENSTGVVSISVLWVILGGFCSSNVPNKGTIFEESQTKSPITVTRSSNTSIQLRVS